MNNNINNDNSKKNFHNSLCIFYLYITAMNDNDCDYFTITKMCQQYITNEYVYLYIYIFDLFLCFYDLCNNIFVCFFFVFVALFFHISLNDVHYQSGSIIGVLLAGDPDMYCDTSLTEKNNCFCFGPVVYRIVAFLRLQMTDWIKVKQRRLVDKANCFYLSKHIENKLLKLESVSKIINEWKEQYSIRFVFVV